jgi:hypothetical protein
MLLELLRTLIQAPDGEKRLPLLAWGIYKSKESSCFVSRHAKFQGWILLR